MSYAEVAAPRPGATQVDRLPAAAPTPLHHIAYLQGHAVLIDLRSVRPSVSKEERNAFLLQDLGLSVADVTDVFMVPSTQLLRVGFAAAEPCQAALAKLQAGVPWAAADNALVYGWSPADSLSRVRVSGCTPGLDLDLVAAHMAQFGRVVQSARGRDRSFGNVFDGVIHLTMQIPPDATLPSFIDLKDEGGHVAERLFVFTDQHRRRCFRCGHTGHVGQFCRAVTRSSGAPASLWSTMVLPAGPPAAVPADGTAPPPPAAHGAVEAAPAAALLLDDSVGRATPPGPSVASGSLLPAAQRRRSGSQSSTASEAMSEPLGLPASLLDLSESQPPSLPPSHLPVAVKSKPSVAVGAPVDAVATPGPVASRGRGSSSSRGRSAAKSADKTSKSAERAAQSVKVASKRAAEPLTRGAAKYLNLATPPSLDIADASLDGGDTQ
jgi:hypothetical protein